MKKDKQKIFEQWREKGIEWVMQRLWVEKNENREQINRMEIRHRSLLRPDFDKMYEKANENMAKVLSEVGIKPDRLRITWEEPDCSCCDDNGTDQCYFEEYICPMKKVVGTISLYTYKIDDDYLRGITAAFESAEYSVFKVEDMNTKAVIYEREADEEVSE